MSLYELGWWIWLYALLAVNLIGGVAVLYHLYTFEPFEEGDL